jgi:hypothetical protein
MQMPQAAKKAEQAAALVDAKKEVKTQASKVLSKETAAQKPGLAAQQAALKPKPVAAPRVGGLPEPAPDPKKDPALNPNSESEHVKGATYEAVKGKAFVKGAADTKDIDPNDVSQGQLGDCYFVAALAALAHQSPETLRQRVKENGDGTYTVTFHEGGDVVVDGRFPTKNGNVQFASKGDESPAEGAELWVMLIEKAWAKLKGGYEDIRGSKVRMSSTDAMQAITGKETRVLRPGSMNEAELFTVLADAQAKGWPATLGVKNLTDVNEIKAAKATGLVPNHAFAILKVDQAAKTLTLYNPWGAEYKVPPITFDTLSKYVQNIQINKD